MLFNIFTFVAFLSGLVLIGHSIFSDEDYPDNERFICVIIGIASIVLGFFMLNTPL